MMRLKLFSKSLGLSQPPGLRFKPNSYVLAICLSVTVLISACAPKPEPRISISQSLKKLETKCQQDFDLQVITRIVGATLYVYLPTDKPMFDYESLKDKAEGGEEAKKTQFAINFTETLFDKDRFNLEYDIIDKKKSSKEDYGYTSSYTDSYVKAQNNLFTAISDSLFDAKPEDDEININFIVIIITDIKKGIESRATIYLQDFKRYMSGDLPYEEFMKRFLADTKGSQSFIGDEIGSHIQYKDVLMGEFLSKQITNRIQFKFQRSSFAPDTEFDNTIVGIVADTLRYYDFKDFEDVRLNNLRTAKKFIFAKEQLASFGDDKTIGEAHNPIGSPGKLIHIIFENGKARIQGEKDSSSSNASE